MSKRPPARPASGLVGGRAEPGRSSVRSFELNISPASAEAMQLQLQPAPVCPVSGGYRLGETKGSRTQDEARRTQDRANRDRIEEFRRKEFEKKMKKLEEKLARDPRLNAATAPGIRLGRQEESEQLHPQPPKEDYGRELREMRMRQQERYNASIKNPHAV